MSLPPAVRRQHRGGPLAAAHQHLGPLVARVCASRRRKRSSMTRSSAAARCARCLRSSASSRASLMSAISLCASQRVRGSRTGLPRRRREIEHPVECESQKILRLSNLPSDKKSCCITWRATRARTHPQILLRNLMFRHFLYCEDVALDFWCSCEAGEAAGHLTSSLKETRRMEWCSAWRARENHSQARAQRPSVELGPSAHRCEARVPRLLGPLRSNTLRPEVRIRLNSGSAPSPR